MICQGFDLFWLRYRSRDFRPPLLFWLLGSLLPLLAPGLPFPGLPFLVWAVLAWWVLMRLTLVVDLGRLPQPGLMMRILIAPFFAPLESDSMLAHCLCLRGDLRCLYFLVVCSRNYSLTSGPSWHWPRALARKTGLGKQKSGKELTT